MASWLGLSAGPLAWAALLEVNYVLSYVACEQRQTWMLHLATMVALALVGGGALAAWSVARPLLGRMSTDGQDRARFMAIAALVLCAWFAVVIVAMEIPVLVVHPCTP
jgi:hypothetical protein